MAFVDPHIYTLASRPPYALECTAGDSVISETLINASPGVSSGCVGTVHLALQMMVFAAGDLLCQ
jgi:hypothetical protein